MSVYTVLQVSVAFYKFCCLTDDHWWLKSPIWVIIHAACKVKEVKKALCIERCGCADNISMILLIALTMLLHLQINSFMCLYQFKSCCLIKNRCHQWGNFNMPGRESWQSSQHARHKPRVSRDVGHVLNSSPAS